MLSDAGLAAIAQAIVDPTASPRAIYIEVGTGTNAPSAGDISLQTPIIRKTLASWAHDAKKVTFTGWFNYSEAIATLKEAGVFIGGSATIGTGTLLSRIAINRVKTGANTETVEWTETLASA